MVKLTGCKENFEQQCKDYEDQLQVIRSKVQQLETECQELHSVKKILENQIDVLKLQVFITFQCINWLGKNCVTADKF